MAAKFVHIDHNTPLLLRGLEKVNLEWTLVSTRYNRKRLFDLGMRMKTA